MGRLSPYALQIQISRMVEQGQLFFCLPTVQDWLRDRDYDPDDYDIQFQQQPAPPGSERVIDVRIELTRKDGQPVDPWLLEQLSRCE
ncbi:MAG: hypothetical protein HC838_05960 [Spirulinaceae cyanobacterium RM2_2_10]|nr:hypothetical protein [Spirulinaceae cyanobacterium SM2_1_0]NJO19697.1 hypothetical protein [Spirulinaceae cyanobacterium RM2_2_10]